MAQQTTRREAVFVVRIWSERGTTVNGHWRASVTRIDTRERRFFTNYGDLCDFLERWSSD